MSENAKPETVETIEEHENKNSAIIENAVNANAAAADISAEETAVITEQREMINTLIEHTKSLQNQINTLMRSGASVTDGTPKHEEPAETHEDYVSFSDLGREMGERRYENKNIEGGKYER